MWTKWKNVINKKFQNLYGNNVMLLIQHLSWFQYYFYYLEKLFFILIYIEIVIVNVGI